MNTGKRSVLKQLGVLSFILAVAVGWTVILIGCITGQFSMQKTLQDGEKSTLASYATILQIAYPKGSIKEAAVLESLEFSEIQEVVNNDKLCMTILKFAPDDEHCVGEMTRFATNFKIKGEKATGTTFRKEEHPEIYEAITIGKDVYTDEILDGVKYMLYVRPMFRENQVVGAYLVGLPLDYEVEIITPHIIEMFRNMLVGLVITLLASSPLFFWIIRRMRKRAYGIVGYANLISDLDLTADSEDFVFERPDDEFDVLLDVIEATQETMKDCLHTLLSVEQVSLDVKEQTTESISTFESSTSAIGQAMEKLAEDNMHQVQIVNNCNTTVQSLATTMQETVEALQAITDISEQLKASTTSNHQMLFSLKDNFNEINAETSNATTHIGSTVTAIESIKDFVNVIQEVASRTNLLALNANIEAARAGEAGKGFAVVAKEIGNLAQSAKEQADLIVKVVDTLTKSAEEMQHASQTQVEVLKASDARVTEVGESFRGLEDLIGIAMARVLDIIDSLRTSAKSTDELQQAFNNIAVMTESLAAASQETLASVEEQSSTASELSGIISNLDALTINIQELAGKFTYEVSDKKDDAI